MNSRLFRTLIAGLMLVGVGRVIVVAQGNPEAAKVTNPVAATPESIDAGKVAYQKHCPSCHGIKAEGGPGNDLIQVPSPNLTDDKWEHGSTDGEIFYVIKNGIEPDLNMIPWRNELKDPEIWNVVNYLRSIAKKP